MEVNKKIIQAIILSVLLIAGFLINASYAAQEHVNAEEFKIQSLVFCSEKPTDFKGYKEQPKATYKPTDTVWIYGDTNYITLNENPDGTKEMWMAIYLRVRAPDGRIFVEGEFFNQHINKPAETDPEKFWFDAWVGATTRFEEGKYSVEIEVTDKLADKTANVSSVFTVSTTTPTPKPRSNKEKISSQLDSLVTSINSGDVDNILNLISPNARVDLVNEIDTQLRSKKISYEMEITSFEELEDNKVKVKGRFAASGIGWNISGLSNYFIFEPVNGNWLIVDTDFHEKLGAEAVFRFVGTIFLVLILVLIPLFGFWLWMLIDCAKRDIENKTIWILILIFLSILGAILYYFIVRRKYKKEQ